MQTIRFVIIAAIIALSAAAFWVSYQTGELGPQTSQVLQGSAGPKIGGPFELIDHNGVKVTDQSFDGRHLLVFFGYTFCPDICPVTLAVIATALDELGPDADKVMPLFITADPARDTAEVLNAYVSSFHPSIVGLTGSEEQIDSAAKAFGVYRARSSVDTGDPDNYLVDHTSITYLMTPENAYAAHFSHGASSEDIAAGIRRILSGG